MEIIIVCEWASHGRRPPSKHTNRQLLEHIIERENRIMADLTNLQATLDKIVTDEQTAANDVQAAFARLQASIDALSVGQITQAQIDALSTQAQAVDDSLTALDAAATSEDVPPTA